MGSVILTIATKNESRHASRFLWLALRIGMLAFFVFVIVLAILRPQIGLKLVWNVIVPLLPIVIFIAPGLWRNVCPLAIVNQIPSTFKFSLSLRLPKPLRDNALLIATLLFLTAVPLRHIVLEDSGIALAAFLLASAGLAFVGGVMFSGKSGWCSQFCPMLPIERAYGQTPLVNVPDNFCKPCTGCTSNCLDAIPNKAFWADLKSANRYWSMQRRLFVGMLPGIIVGFFHTPDLPVGAPWFLVYAYVLIPAAISLLTLQVLNRVPQFETHRVTSVFTVASINLYYWYSFPVLLATIAEGLNAITPISLSFAAGDEFWLAFQIALYAPLVGLSLIWIGRTLTKETAFARRV